MKSISIKTNNMENINHLLNLLDNTKINICYSCLKFKHYKNIIIHFSDKSIQETNTTISEFLSILVIDSYEQNLLKRIIFSNYFYFNSQERKTVFDICLNLLSENESYPLKERQNIISETFKDYLQENNKIVLDGFINFRLKRYQDILNTIIDDAVNHFIIEREYWEFISLLKVYVNSEISSIDKVHLIYNNSESILLDENNNKINIDKKIFNAKYLSDITFSSNDYILNTLLNIVPKKIIIHLSDGIYDEFINTLLLIFEDRIEFSNGLNKVEKNDTLV